ncbi:MAG TPA: TIGR03435 family protein [Gemmatimonadales bacterium]|nr:TIGR03435 family protein [Gemmatimonadales bacterium]
MDATRMTMAELASLLTSNLDQPVLDKTGLTGFYRFTVELPADASVLRTLRSAGIATTVDGTPIGTPTGISAFKVIEGLGLRLERRREPFDVVVVDKMERRPIGN